MTSILKRFIGTAGIAAYALAVATPAVAQHFPDDADLQVMLDYLVADGATIGVVLGILEADGSTRILTAGTAAAPGASGADLGAGAARPLGARSVFEIGSINKTFTGALLAEMAARGDVALDDPVAKYLPAEVRMPTRNGREITLLDLATHTSGLPRLPNNHVPANMADPYADYTIAKLYAFLSGHELRRDPGAEHEYSNLGYGLLGHALARAGGMPFTELLRARILDPLGMDMTGYALEGDVAAWMVRGHAAAGNDVAYWFTTEAIQGAGGMRSNMADMLAYLAANVGEAETDLERALRTAHTARRPAGNAGEIGLGWVTREVNGRRVVSHNGATGGFTSSMGFAPDIGVGFVMLANRNPSDDIGMDLLVFGRPIDDPVVDVAPDVLDRYAGSYGVPAQPIVVQREDDGTMTARTPGNVRFRMYADSDTSFYMKRAPWRIAFARADGPAQEPAQAMVLTINNMRRTLPRIDDEVAARAGDVVDLPVTGEDVIRYQGTYLLVIGDRTLELRIFGQGGRLVSQAASQAIAALRHQGDHTFVPDFDDSARLIFTVEDGRATRVTLHQGGGVFTGDRQR